MRIGRRARASGVRPMTKPVRSRSGSARARKLCRPWTPSVASISSATPCRRTSLNNRCVPRLSAFYGIVIYMYRPDHPPPHFHAQYGEHVAQIALGSLEVLSGSLPPRALRLVREWAGLHADELTANWDLAQALEPLVPVEPLA